MSVQLAAPAGISRRGLFSILPAAAAGCFGCAGTMCAQGMGQHTSTEKADLTWEQVFRLAYQKDLIPLLKQLSEKIGREELARLIREASDQIIARKNAGRPPVIRDLTAFAANLSNPPPLIQHALDAEITEQSAEAFEYRVKSCLWAKMFVDQKAGELGYAMICYPDYAVARGLNPKLRLIRNKTLMQGDDCCVLRYVMES